MIRAIVRLAVVAVLLIFAMLAYQVTHMKSAPGHDPGLRDGYGSTLRTLEREPEPVKMPAVEVEDIELATFFSRLARNCDSSETIEYVKRKDLGSFADCLRSGNDPWILEAPASEGEKEYFSPGTSALYLAAAVGSLEIVELLVSRYGVSPDWGGSLHRVPLIVAIEGGHFDVVTFLLDQGADLRRWNVRLENPVYVALKKRKDPKFLEAVLVAGAYPNDVTIVEAITPLNIAINQRLFEHALLLVENGACIPRDTKHVRHLIEQNRNRAEHQAIRRLLDAMHDNYDPTCKWQTTFNKYDWELERQGSDVEIALSNP